MDCISGGISLGQLASMILKSTQAIYDYYQHMKAAPSFIKQILREVEVCASILKDIDCQQLQKGSAAVSIAKKELQKVARELEETARRLQRDMRSWDTRRALGMKRQWAKVRAVLKEDDLEELLERLSRAKQTLSLAISNYGM